MIPIKKSAFMPQISKPTTKDYLLLLLVSVIWGSAFSSIKVVVGETGALWAAALRVGIGFLFVVPFLLVIKKRTRISVEMMKSIVFVAMLNMVIPFILISWALHHIDAGIGSLLLATTPFIAMIIGHFTTTDERITGGRVVAVCLAMFGIAVLVGPDAVAGVGSSQLLAQLAIVLAGACYVTAGFAMRRIDADPVTFTASALFAGSVVLISIAYLFAGPVNLSLSREAAINLIWLGVVPTGLAYLLRFWLVRRLGVSMFALAMNAVPIFGIMIGALYLGEVIHWTTLVALGFVLAGLAVARRSGPQNKATA